MVDADGRAWHPVVAEYSSIAHLMTKEMNSHTGINLQPASIKSWIENARAKVTEGRFSEEDLNELASNYEINSMLRQRLLYLHADTPSPRSAVLSIYMVDPVPGGAAVQLSAEPELPYKTVHDALVDGWQIVHFPDQRAAVSDRDIDIYGYEFVLQKLEAFS